MRLWDPATGIPVGGPLQGHHDLVRAVAAVPLADGRVLLASAGDDGTVRLWEPGIRSPLGDPLEGHISSVLAVPLADGRVLLASADSDRTVRLWDPPTGIPVAVLCVTGSVQQLAATNFQIVAAVERSLADFEYRPAWPDPGKGE